MQSCQLRRYAARSSHFLLLMLFWYLSCYFLMMNWRVLAFDPIRESIDASSYLLALRVRVPGDLTVYSGSSSWANRFFLPIDALLYRVKAAIGFPEFVSSRTVWTIWLFAFWLNLLLPFFAAIRGGGQSLKGRIGQVLLSLLAAGWYFSLISLYHRVRVDNVNVFLGKSLAVVGTVIAVAALYWIARARGYRVVVPLAVAPLLGTIWLLASLPCAHPYM